jgi:hypothetical protein
LPRPSPLRPRLDQHEPQLRHLVALLHDEGRADRRAIELGDEAALQPRLELAQELRRDLCDQRLEADVPAIDLEIEPGMGRDHPADIAGAMLADRHGRLRAGGARQQRLRPLQRRDEARLLTRPQARQDHVGLPARGLVERCEGFVTHRGQLQLIGAAVPIRPRPLQPADLHEALQQAREIGRIEPELARQLPRPPAIALRQFVEHAPLGQPEAGAVQIAAQRPR